MGVFRRDYTLEELLIWCPLTSLGRCKLCGHPIVHGHGACHRRWRPRREILPYLWWRVRSLFPI